jgi:hypothetical protein
MWATAEPVALIARARERGEARRAFPISRNPDHASARAPPPPGVATAPEVEDGIDYDPLWAGESCSVVNDIKPAAQIVADLVRDAERSDCADAR